MNYSSLTNEELINEALGLDIDSLPYIMSKRLENMIELDQVTDENELEQLRSHVQQLERII